MMRNAWLLVCITILGTGCGTNSFSKRLPIDALHLLGTAVAMNLDDKPGADGMGVRVYAMNKAENSTVQISKGGLELLVFDGNIRAEDVATTRPLLSWLYSAAELRRHEQRTGVGISYVFVPIWTNKPPTFNRVTVMARYTNAPAAVLYSAPVSVPLAGR